MTVIPIPLSYSYKPLIPLEVPINHL